MWIYFVLKPTDLNANISFCLQFVGISICNKQTNTHYITFSDYLTIHVNNSLTPNSSEMLQLPTILFNLKPFDGNGNRRQENSSLQIIVGFTIYPSFFLLLLTLLCSVLIFCNDIKNRKCVIGTRWNPINNELIS